MMDMIEYCREKTDTEILELPDVKERTVRYFEQDKNFKEMVLANARIDKNVIILDLRNQKEVFTGNRFLLYSLFPEQNISIQTMWGFQKQNIVITCGYSILKKDATINVGSLMLRHGGGGHHKVGTCQVPVDSADTIIQEIVDEING